jgi:hypothetical protein
MWRDSAGKLASGWPHCGGANYPDNSTSVAEITDQLVARMTQSKGIGGI